MYLPFVILALFTLYVQVISVQLKRSIPEDDLLDGCVWSGTAPICYGGCVEGFVPHPDFDPISDCNHDGCDKEAFGEPCWYGTTKVYCCKIKN
uniref:Secreted protein n=1 Tax=Acrobeloides nanus TaxID=290746 RepID=A0A914CIE7_9BILA